MTRRWSETRVAIESGVVRGVVRPGPIDPEDVPDLGPPRDTATWWGGFMFGSVVGFIVGALIVFAILWAADATSLDRRLREPLPETTGARG